MPKQPTDRSLLQMMSQKQPDAFDVFYDRHIQTIYNLVFRIIRERTVADEIVEGLFWLIWQNAHYYIEADQSLDNEQSGVPVWLYHMAHTKSLERQGYLQRGAKGSQLPVPDLNKATITSSLETWDSLYPLHLNTRLDPKRLLATLDSLLPEQRQCLELAYFDNQTQQKIAEELGTPLEMVKNWLSLGLLTLTELLDYPEKRYTEKHES